MHIAWGGQEIVVSESARVPGFQRWGLILSVILYQYFLFGKVAEDITAFLKLIRLWLNQLRLLALNVECL